MNDKPLMGLSSRGNEPTPEWESHRAYATAVHELTHTFSFVSRPPTYAGTIPSPSVNPWEWFDEGTAVFVEMHALPDNWDCLRYFLDWCDNPHTSLDGTSSVYQAGMFVRFLVRRLGYDLLRRVWEIAPSRDSAIEALEQALRERNKQFASPDPAVADVFAAGYCADAYFLSDLESGCFDPHLLAHHGERLATETFEFNATEKEVRCRGDRVNHLGCRYYRFRPNASSSRLEVTVEPDPPTPSGPAQPTSNCLRAELYRVGPNYQRLAGRQPLAQQASGQQGISPVLKSALEGFSAEKIDHVALIVTNCSYGTSARDGVSFGISARTD
jgi:hypothetical protein